MDENDITAASARTTPHSMDAIAATFVTDVNGKIVQMNELMERLITDTLRIPDEDRMAFRLMRQFGIGSNVNRIRRDLLKERRVTEELRVDTPSGEYWFELHLIPRHRADASLDGTVGILFDITQRKKSEEAVIFQAFHDPLTSLPNRRALVERMRTAILRAQRSAERLAVLFIDLDGFKSVNDISGHDAGDRILVEIAERLRLLLRKDDVISRLGGDEFVVLLQGISNPAALPSVARKILDQIRRPVAFGEASLQVGASIGISLFPDDASEPERLIQQSDRAMYRAKQHGRNAFRFFSDQSTHEQAPQSDDRGRQETGDPTAELIPILSTDTLTVRGYRINLKGLIFTAEQKERVLQNYERAFEKYAALREGERLPFGLIVPVLQVSGRLYPRKDDIVAIATSRGIPVDEMSLAINRVRFKGV